MFLRHHEKWQSLVEKLLPRSRPLRPRDVPPLPVTEKGKRDGFTKARLVLKSAELVKQLQGDPVGPVREAEHHPAEENVSSASACSGLGSAAGERLFVFRDPPESRDSASVPTRKRRKNFLNLKKGSVAPAT